MMEKEDVEYLIRGELEKIIREIAPIAAKRSYCPVLRDETVVFALIAVTQIIIQNPKQVRPGTGCLP